MVESARDGNVTVVPRAMVGDLYYDPYDVATVKNPYPVFRRLREEAPVYYNDDLGFYALSRFEDVERAHVNREIFISSHGGTLGLLRSNAEIPPGTVIFEDPPTHTIHRALISRMFTPRRVADLEPQIRSLCVQLLDPLVGRGGFDYVVDVAKEVPMRVIGMLLGIPESDQVAVREHFGRGGHDRDDRDREEILSGRIFAEYMDWRVNHPSDDIMTQLLYAEFEDERGTKRRLTREELLAYVNIVAAAGNETTRLLIGWTGKLLAEYPDQRRMLVEDPSMIPTAIEEILRYDPPSLQTARYVARDVEVQGETIPEGSIVALLIASANRDDRQFPDPDRFDIRREPGTIFSFGFGSHYCLGQALARLEGRIALEEVLERFPEWDVDDDGAEFGYVEPELRGWSKLPVVTAS